jgi:hypothetical protein
MTRRSTVSKTKLYLPRQRLAVLLAHSVCLGVTWAIQYSINSSVFEMKLNLLSAQSTRIHFRFSRTILNYYCGENLSTGLYFRLPNQNCKVTNMICYSDHNISTTLFKRFLYSAKAFFSQIPRESDRFPCHENGDDWRD